MEIKVKFFSIVRRSGISKKSNNSYDMIQLSYVMPLETGQFGSMKVEGSGLTLIELEANSSCLTQCADLLTLQDVVIDINVNPRNPNKNIVGLVKPLSDKLRKVG